MRRLALLTAAVVALASAQLPGLVITGNPESDSGARWVYRDTVNDTLFDLAGVLYKPAGPDTFPAVILSHGLGGNAYGIGTSLARGMRPWGLVCIATSYTHAGGVPVGSPGDSTMPGAGFANIQRAMACRRILASLGYVDTTRLAAHGHSMGAFLTGGLAGTHPAAFKVASHTAGGVNDEGLPWTKSWQAESITCPYQMHHGDEDLHVPLADDQRMDSILGANGTVRELVVYPGRGHGISADSVVLRRVHEWYTEHGLFDTSQVVVGERAEGGRLSAEPITAAIARGVLFLRGGNRGNVGEAVLLDASGRRVMALAPGANDISALSPGVYFALTGQDKAVHKVLITR